MQIAVTDIFLRGCSAMINNKRNVVNGLIDGLLYKKTNKCDSVSIERAEKVVRELKEIFYPEFIKREGGVLPKRLIIFKLFNTLNRLIKSCLTKEKTKSKKLTEEFIESLPAIKNSLDKDLTAFILKDPATSSKKEVVLCYGGFHAIFIYRLANRLSAIGVPLLARSFSSIARKTTGIDIHPSAQIGEYFFIDHGVGIVIGETAKIGNNVAVYHGVTLGAVSLKDAENLRGVKRHPTVLDDVTLYANVTVLGGDTVISKGKVVPANALITKSI